MISSLIYFVLMIGTPVIISAIIMKANLKAYREEMYDILCEHAADIRCLKGNCDTFEDEKEAIEDGYYLPVTDGLSMQQHKLVAGTTGSGKTTTCEYHVMRLLNAGHDIYCLDLKRTFYGKFKKHFVEIVLPDDIAGAGELMDRLYTEAKRRQEEFEKAQASHKKLCEDTGDYYKLTGIKMPIITLIIDELMSVVEEVEDLEPLYKLLAMGRSAGIFVFAMTQYMKADILERRGLINFTTKVALGFYDEQLIKNLIGNLSKEKVAEYKQFMTGAGKAIIWENGQHKTYTMPKLDKRVLEALL